MSFNLSNKINSLINRLPIIKYISIVETTTSTTLQPSTQLYFSLPQGIYNIETFINLTNATLTNGTKCQIVFSNGTIATGTTLSYEVVNQANVNPHSYNDITSVFSHTNGSIILQSMGIITASQPFTLTFSFSGNSGATTTSLNLGSFIKIQSL